MSRFSIAIFLVALSLQPVTANQNASTKKTNDLKASATETAIYVKSMHCKTCAKKIAGKLFTVPGVMRVRTNVKQNIAVITPQPKKKLNAQALWKAVHSAGFKPLKLVGPGGTYLPAKNAKTAQRVSSGPRSSSQQR